MNIYCCITNSSFMPQSRGIYSLSACGMRWRRLIYRLLCRRNDLNTVSAKLVFQMRMNIKKHAVQRPKKYMWAVQLSRPHIFMQPLGRLGRTFLYNHFLFGNDNSTCCSTTTVSVVGGICQ